MKKKFYITTPIYYVNAKPHIGSAYPTIMADILARYHRLNGDDVFFLTGTDENSQKNVQAAEAEGENNVMAYLDRMSAAWASAWDTLRITNDGFIRTTELRHQKGVVEFFHRVEQSGDIYKGQYEGLYCIGCEAFITEKELVDGLCPDHKKPPVALKEENYFFKASRYKDTILKHIEDNPGFIEPQTRRNEVVSYINAAFGDISISRGWKTNDNVAGVTVGIPVPGDPSQALYVWFDALINYLTGIGFGEDEDKFQKFWPVDVHIVGKEITKFHCALWPAMLLSAGLPLPQKVYAHGWLTVDGQKMSKSLGNIVDPITVVGEFGLDTLRYFLLREFTWGGDGDFSLARLKERYQSDLANGVGNLSRRILTLGQKALKQGKLTSADRHPCPDAVCGLLCVGIRESVGKVWEAYDAAFTAYRPDLATAEVWKLIQYLDEQIERTKPWELKEEQSPEQWSAALYPFLEGLRQLVWMLRPIMPDTSEELFQNLGQWTWAKDRTFQEGRPWGLLSMKGLDINRGKVLFPRIEK